MQARRICLVTTSQPSANPRLLKEADALTEAGYDVHVVGAYRVDWATASDARLLRDRRWKFTFIDWRRDVAPGLFWRTRGRHFLARKAQGVPGLRAISLTAAVERVAPDLEHAAGRIEADLYVAHNLGALPAAAGAATRHCGRLGFDAEDYHRGEFLASDQSQARQTVERVEEKFLPRCDYVTAASDGIGAAYAPMLRCAAPTTILNVFPMASRPSHPRLPAAGSPLSLYWFSQTIGPDRGLEDVVRAMGRVPDGTVELHLRGRWHDGYAADLRRVADIAGVPAHRIRSLPPADADDMVKLAAEFDVGLATETGQTQNRQIALTNKIFTYLLAGTACLTTSTPAQQRLAGHLGCAAEVYRPGDVEAAARAIHRWADEPARLAAARRAAWDLGERQYNWDVEKQKYLDVIKGVFARV